MPGGSTSGVGSGYSTGVAGTAPGGGGSGSQADEDINNSAKSWSTGGGGGGGGYTTRSFIPSTGPSPGIVLSYTVGVSGTNASSGGAGAVGRLKITWS